MRGILYLLTGMLLLSLLALPGVAYQRVVLIENYTNWG